MKRICLFVFLTVASAALFANGQNAELSPENTLPKGSGQELVDTDFIFIGAHPDDENGGFGVYAQLTDAGFDGVVYTITAGEGGGNATGREKGKALGLVRLEEERRSLELVGIDRQYFGGQNDFYYSLFAEEALEKWGGDDFIGDIVRVIRMTRPEVILTMWPGVGTHGHHQMAGRAATLAFQRAGDPTFYPEHIEEGGLEPFQPLKLYYGSSRVPVQVITSMDVSGVSPKGLSYANLAQLARMQYRTQGWDKWMTYPVENIRPVRYGLIKSMVPVSEPEDNILTGTHISVDGLPPGVKLYAETSAQVVGLGETIEIDVMLENASAEMLNNLMIDFESPAGWTIQPGRNVKNSVAPGETVTRSFTVQAPSGSDGLGRQQLWFYFDSSAGSGRNYSWIMVESKVTGGFKPLFDIAGYRDFARETETQWLVESLPPRIPLTVGQENTVAIELANNSSQDVTGTLSFDFPAGVNVSAPGTFDIPANSVREVEIRIRPDETALPPVAAGRRKSALVEGGMVVAAEGIESRSDVQLILLPGMTLPSVSSAPVIDGDLSDMPGYANDGFTHEDRWSGEEDNPRSVSGKFRSAYDSQNLYIGVSVTDDNVITETSPDDIHAHWEADSVEITVDPTGNSAFTNTTFKVGIFPGTSAGFQARAARDADANQGLIEVTAPGMEVASRKTAEGYDLEVKIPWSVMPSSPQKGDTIGFNVLVYDRDVSGGGSIGGSRTGWGSVIGAQQATPYVWPKVQLD